MLFSSPAFLFAFFPASVLLVWCLPASWRNGAILVTSLLFYFWGEPVFTGIALLSALLDYWLARRMERARQRKTACRWMVAGIASNGLLLIYFKYAGFLSANVGAMAADFGYATYIIRVALPIGISFIVFEKISFLVDIWRGIARAPKRLTDYLLFVFLFPKLLAGPIIKFHELVEQISDRNRRPDRTAGLRRFFWGLAKKVLVADVCAEAADAIFALPPAQLGFASAWLGILFFAVQIYFDFSGYSDMAIGLGRLLGFHLPENFDRPYHSCSFSEFWRRWHISLSSWIRDYLYIPLGGSRGGALRTAANLWVCFLLSGLWHGAAWNFVAWGAYNGVFLTADRLFWLRLRPGVPSWVAALGTLFLVTLGWGIFRATSLEQATALFRALASPRLEGSYVYVRAHEWWAMAGGLALSFVVGTEGFRRLERRFVAFGGGLAMIDGAAAALGLLAIAKSVTVAFSPFIYFRF